MMDSDAIGDNSDEEFKSDSDLNWNHHDVHLMILRMITQIDVSPCMAVCR